MKYLSICFLALAISLTAPAAVVSSGTKPGRQKQVKTLTNRLTTLQTQLRQAESRNRQLQRTISGINTKAQTRIDSLATLKTVIITQKTTVATLESTITTLTASLAQVQAQNQLLQATLADQLEKSKQQVVRLEYDRRVMTDRTVFRVYKLSPAEVRQRLLATLNKAGSGFKFDNDIAVRGAIRVMRPFENEREPGGLFGKTSDLLLELTLLIEPHQYDPTQALLRVQPKLMQKSRSGKKPLEEQTNEDKVALYRDKAMHLLEGDLRAMSEK
jgi:hypothetical protein